MSVFQEFEQNIRKNIPPEGSDPQPRKKGGGSLKHTGKKVRNVFLGILAAIFVLAAAFGSFYQIQEQEQAVLITFGIPKSVTETGLHFKIPFIQQVKKVNTTIQGFPIGYNQSETESMENESVMITKDYNFIDVDFYVEYRITDPVKYLYASRRPEDILGNISQSCIRTVIGSYNVDDVLTTGKNEIQANIKDMIIGRMEEYDLGLQLINISMQDSQPPTEEVMQAFKAVETAKQGKETALNNANKYRNQKLPEAQAQADQIVQEAQAYKETRINEAEAQVARFNSMYEEYRKNPVVTQKRMFYEAMEDVLPDLKVIIDDGSGTQKIIPIEPFDGGTTLPSAAANSTSSEKAAASNAENTAAENADAASETAAN